MEESKQDRTNRILSELKLKYPGKKAFDLDGRGMHFLSEIEPTHEHPEYDRAVEVIISSKPHKHIKMSQKYTILRGTLNLFIEGNEIILGTGDTYTIEPNTVHWATSESECWVEIYSEPGWTEEDHVLVDL